MPFPSEQLPEHPQGYRPRPPSRGRPIAKKEGWRDYAQSIFLALLIAFFIRSFVVEAFKIPSGSMIPTLMIGDHIFVNKFAYGLRIPFTKTKILDFGTPQRGEPIVFMYPMDESKDFIKRVIGLPGDHIHIQGDEVLVNDEPLERKEIQVTADDQSSKNHLLKVMPEAFADAIGVHTISTFPDWENYSYLMEKVGDHHHLVQFDRQPSHENIDLEVPPHHLFVMGDNRDNSSDSREWGFVPLENVKGRALFVWLSLDRDHPPAFLPWGIRWNRFGKWIR